MLDYYTFLEVPPNAADEMILEAYLAKVQGADAATVTQADTALGVLTDPQQRAAFDQARRARASGRAAGKATEARSATAPPLARAAPSRPARPPSPASRTAASSTTSPRATTAPPRARFTSAPSAPAPRNIPRTVPVVVGIALLAGIVFAALLLTNRASGSAAGGVGAVPAAGLATQAVEARLVNGVQTVDVLLNGDTFQYEPPVIKVKQGLPVHFNLRVKGDPG